MIRLCSGWARSVVEDSIRIPGPPVAGSLGARPLLRTGPASTGLGSRGGLRARTWSASATAVNRNQMQQTGGALVPGAVCRIRAYFHKSINIERLGPCPGVASDHRHDQPIATGVAHVALVTFLFYLLSCARSNRRRNMKGNLRIVWNRRATRAARATGSLPPLCSQYDATRSAPAPNLLAVDADLGLLVA